MKTRTKISGYILRNASVAVFFSVALIALSWAANAPNNWYHSAGTAGSDAAAKIASQPRVFSFAERVAFQRVIEEVYWRHRIWPKENPDSKPGLDAVMSQAQLENKVTAYLRDSQTLEDSWQKPITAEQLQAEMDRMARYTKQPQVLRELFKALGNDPAVIAECLARPMLVERLLAELTLQDETPRFASLQTDDPRTMAGGPPPLGQVAYTLPNVAGVDDTWTATSTTNAPSARSGHTAVWTGSEMIVWGGENYYGVANGGARYNPSTDSWTATSPTNAPGGRSGHTAVWTGSEMIVWGGTPPDNPGDGGRYNPSTDSWTATNITNAPFGREYHTAVWTGSEMIIWGGAGYYSPEYVYFNTGGRYNPSTNSWTATSTTNGPTARSHHRAEWTGSEMIVWGGEFNDGAYHFLNTGGRYNPSTNSWTATNTTNAPEARTHFTAVWTGSEMIVWGGYGEYNDLSDGGRYNPGTNSWTATSTTNAPEARSDHTAIWTGNEMIVWGGYRDNTGGRYDPATDSWTATSTTNAPRRRQNATAIWTGSEMIVWGGGTYPSYYDTGGRYCARPVSYDFNGDRHPDYLLYKTSTQQTTLWYLNNNVFINGRYGPTVPSGWALVAVGDFNTDGRPDYVLYNATTHRTYIWYMRDNVHIDSAQGPTLNAGWSLIGTADFNGDGHPDYLLFNPTTRATAIFYLNNNVRIGWSNGPTLNAGWSLVGAADFNRDGHPDYLLFDPTTHATLIYYMNNNVRVRWASGPTLNARWSLVGAADFNGDGHPDYLLFDPTTHATLIYYMNNNVGLWWASGPTLNAGWSLVAP